ncbi:MAG TPA: LPXTG cell wall anchor domain-containing protein [Bacillota bacterium]|nr:LPXTG cell wall anchor domain-containing protein [Bacillota bacterium]
MRKRNFKKLAALFIVAIYALSTLVFVGAEDGVDGWTGVDAVDGDIGISTIETTTDMAADGESSLMVAFVPGHSKYQVRLPLEGVLPGQTLIFKVFIPEETNLNGFQPFSQDSGWGWVDDWNNADEGEWLEVEYTIPEGSSEPIQRVGIQFVYPDGEILEENDVVVYIDSAALGFDVAFEEDDNGDADDEDDNGNADDEDDNGDADDEDDNGDADADDEDDDETVPKTGYASTIGFVLLAAASSGVLVSRKRRK